MIDWAERVREDYRGKGKAKLLESASKLKTKGVSTTDIVDALGLTEQEVIDA
jgi:hypothetical protein